MKLNDMFKSNYLKADDVLKPKRFTIAGVSMQEIGDERQEKPVVTFEETEQGLVLNKTNAAVLFDALGSDSADWAGHKVELRREKTQHKGQIVPCIRVHVPEPPSGAGDTDDLAP